MQGVIDRIENDFVILKFDDGQILRISNKELGVRSKEGVAVEVTFEIDQAETIKRRKRVGKLLEKVFK